jgi:Dolichyl-phosphate-mannose-protein mannosyltransferase
MNLRMLRAGFGGQLLRLRHTALLAFLIFGAAVFLRLGMLERQGLWADEVFSLAMATGHSLEHPAAVADPSLGDFIEHPQPLPASAYRSYLEHEKPVAGVRRVVRAVLLSDTNPPLYYVLLCGWTLHGGTSDGALRLFSVLWALACLPLLWSLGKQFGGRSAAWIACLLFAFAPVAIRYSTEGRMYSMLWFFVLLTAWSALRLHRRGGNISILLLWMLASVAGLLTHHFYFFVWTAILIWLLWQPGKCDRRLIALSTVGVGVIVFPWYSLLPVSLRSWRVTQGWLLYEPSGYHALHTPFELTWSFFSARGWDPRSVLSKRYILLLVLMGAAVLWKLDWHRRGQRYLLLLLWIAATCLGPLAFDLLKGSYTSAISRYALAGLPAAFLLLAAGLSRTPQLVRAFVLLLLLVVWMPGIRNLYSHNSRSGPSFREIARSISERSSESDVILLHSVPSGVLGIARYLESSAPLAAWVGQLGQRRVPKDIETLIAGHRRVFLVKVHTVGASAPQETYLREHATVVDDSRLLSSQTVVFAPRHAEIFPRLDVILESRDGDTNTKQIGSQPPHSSMRR